MSQILECAALHFTPWVLNPESQIRNLELEGPDLLEASWNVTTLLR